MMMSKYLLLLLVLHIGLAASENATQSQATTPPKKDARHSAAASSTNKNSAPAITAEQVKALQDALAAQERRIQQLEQKIQQRDQAWQQVQSQLEKTEATATAAEAKVSEIQSSSSRDREDHNSLRSDINDFKVNVNTLAENAREEQKRGSSLKSLLGRANWWGNIRLSQVDVFLPGQKARVRERIRVRFGLESQLGQDFVAGVALATGTLADSTTTNSDLTHFFERKTVGLDRGYVSYNPKNHKWLSLTGGKFAYNWQRTVQTFDADINPEGFSEKFSFDLNNKYLKNVTLHGLQLLFFENSNVRYDTSGIDSFAAGGQVLLKVRPLQRWTITPSYLVLNWHNSDVLMNAPAFNQGVTVSGTTNIVCNPVTTLNTSPNCAFATVPYAPSLMTNAYKVVSVAPNGNVIRSLQSKFTYSNIIMDNTIDTGLERWPFRLMLEYEENLRAVSNNSHLYQVETSLGQIKNKNDFLFGYTFVRQEQDSVLAAFGESDQRLPTNIVEHVAYAQWKVRSNVLLVYKLYVGRVLDSSLFAPVKIPGAAKTDALQTTFMAPGVLPGQLDHYRKRMQFDVIYTF